MQEAPAAVDPTTDVPTEDAPVDTVEATGQAASDPLDESADAQAPDGRFRVSLDVFEGPFDLLLGLISKHKLDVTEVSLSQVTDEFISFIKNRDEDWPLEEATEFLVVAATLLDLKAARLLPAGDVEDEDDLALLEARDLLFARLLQYRAYKEISSWIGERIRAESRLFPRAVGLDPQFAGLLPEVLLGLGPDEFALLADRALAPKPEPVLSVSHLHMPRVSVREQAAVLVDRLRRQREATFRALVGDCHHDTLTVVARFLALLELFREGAVSFEQAAPLQDLLVRWTGGDDEVEVSDEFDEDAAEDAAEDAQSADVGSDDVEADAGGQTAEHVADVDDIAAAHSTDESHHDVHARESEPWQ
jgi:segregation and condensation protein A